jgi:hypothetical protein
MSGSRTSCVAFISYRRLDSDGMAGRLRDRLMRTLPNWTIFMDVASIDAGVDFRNATDEALNKSSLFLLLIGRRWMGGDGDTRLSRPEDYVRHEIATALGLNLRIIPVLINDARMPSFNDLPDDIRTVAWKNALELRHSRFDDDFMNLVSAISGEPSRATQEQKQSKNTLTRRVQSICFGAILAVALTLTALVINFQISGKAASQWIGDDGAILLLPIAATLGALLGWFFSALTSSPA